MKSLQKYITLAIIVGLTTTLLADPYSQGAHSSNGLNLVVVADNGMSSYTLDWHDTSVPPAAPQSVAPTMGSMALPQAISPAMGAVEAPVIMNLADLPALIRAAQPGPSPTELAAASRAFNRGGGLRGPSRVEVPTHNITFRADRYFDVWANNYRYVSRIEVLTYRGGTSPRTEVYENSPQYSTYEVYIRELRAGDRYEVRVTWDDGKYRIFQRDVTRRPEYNVRVSEPL